MLRGISGTSSSDVWTVGSYEEVISSPPYYIEHELILHWNGSSWQQFPPLNLSTTLDDLYDVEAISTNNVWAVGMYNQPNVHAELLHFDGNSWANQPLPTITGGSYLNSLHALNANDIWAAGGKFVSPTRLAYVIHYNGSSWTEVSVPPVGSFRNVFDEIHGISSNDIWAVGHRGESFGDYHALAMHWNGSAWVNSPLPASITSQQSEILNVRMVSSNDVWASGYYLTGGGFMIHWDGTSWTETTPPTVGGAFAINASNDIYSFGGQISHFNGIDWTVVDALSQQSYPSLVQAVRFSNSEIWAAGRTVDASNNFFGLVYRSVNHQPVFTGGLTQTWNTSPNTNSPLPQNLVRTTDADISQILSYSVVTPPSHGVLNGFPATAITNNGTATPAGMSYTPAAGYTGTDQFVLKVSAGDIHSQTTINVNILSTLPLNLRDFRVTNDNGHAKITWVTEAESNTSRFEIERSQDGTNFQLLSSLPAAGNNPGINYYNYLDLTPAQGINYYRLKLINLDGTVTVYEVRTIRFDTVVPPVILMRNPARNRQVGFILNSTGKFTATIYDLQGRRIKERIINNNFPSQYIIDAGEIADGIYLLNISGQDQKYSQKILLSRL
jgi:hypothetical protein